MTRKTMIFIFCAAIAAAAFIAVFPGRNSPEKNIPVSAPPASTASERFDYFASHGWEVEETAEKNITIPSQFTGEYAEYVSIQDKQGLNLRECAGKPAKLYIYSVKNYSPGSQKLLAELIVCDDSIAASLIYSEDGESCRIAVS